MTNKQLTLVRVVIRGPNVANAEGTLGGVIYKREHAGQNGIYMTLRTTSWRDDVRYPQRDDERMKVTVARLPLGRNVAVEFCGTDIDTLCEAAGAAPSDNHAQAVLAIRPVLRYLQEHFAIA